MQEFEQKPLKAFAINSVPWPVLICYGLFLQLITLFTISTTDADGNEKSTTKAGQFDQLLQVSCSMT